MHRRHVIAVTALAIATLLFTASTAWAHVTLYPASVPKGSFSIFSFSVPNESATANTVKVEVTFPTTTPIASVRMQPLAGWTVVTQTATLAKPVKTDDGQVTQAVNKVTWTSVAGGLKPGEFNLFTVSAGPMPAKVSSVAFPTIQTYSDGTSVSWIQPTAKGAAEPDHPLPVLKLTKAT